MEQVIGYVERISYQNEENGFSVLQLKCASMQDLVCVVGLFMSINVGETLHCEGVWTRHAVYGRQFECKTYQVKAPSDVLGIKKYLGSGLIKGIGPIYAARIVGVFGKDTLEIIDKASERLKEVGGLGKKRIEMILSCWADQKVVRDVMVFLQGHGVSPAYAQKIFKIYGEKCIAVVQKNPYQLARDVHGIGFKTADKIAETLGVLKDASIRIDSGIEYVLRELADDGHICYPEEKFLPAAESTLDVSKELIIGRMDCLHAENRIERFPLIIEGAPLAHVWFKPYFNAEIGIAQELEKIRKSPSALRPIDPVKALSWVQEKLHIALASAQAEAVAKSCVGKLLIITGGPGTGKSTITKAILKISEQLTSKILLAAPTGRAAKRMTEITGKKAQTIHSLLEYDFRGGFKRKKDNPLDCDLLIVDESSMIDTLLMFSLLKAVPSSCRVIFVGDIHQLPSVGPGVVLQDMIHSLQIPVVTLNEIFRQAQGSMIIMNAHKINQGQFPQIHNPPDSDFFFIEAQTPEEVLSQIVKLVAVRIPSKYGFHALDQIQVLSPMKRGVVGIENLNTVLQEQLNPKNDPLFKAGRRFHTGDKIMQIRNNYKKNVYNGDVGRIVAIDLDEQQVIARFDEAEVLYEFSELDELVLAYAVSVHKYQGSECPCIVMPVHTTHLMMLQRNLLYTGVTRGKKLVILVGTAKALAIAVKNDEIKQRHTGLRHALLGYLN
jgi:exodeoxyribonuclease V alpha subunit